MSPSRLNRIDELNYLVKLHDVHYFRTFVESNRVSYRVAMFKAIESGSSTLVDIVRWHHPHPEEADIELECLHAAFRGHLSIYEVIPLNEDLEEFNPYRENMYLFHGQLNKVDLLEMNMYDLLSPNVIPATVCDAILQSSSSLSSCLATGVLLAYCIHNHEHWNYLEQSQDVFLMDDMFQYALFHKNHKLSTFLINKYKETRQYTKYNYKLRNGSSFQKQRRFEGDPTMYDHYLAELTEASVGVGKNKPAYKINEQNVCLSNEMFEWQGPFSAHVDVDAYFEQVLGHVHQLLDQGIELRHC